MASPETIRSKAQPAGRSRSSPRPPWLCLAGLAAWLVGSSACAQSETAAEYKLKAAVMFNLAKFVTWPTNAFGSNQAPFIVGVVGRDPFGPLLDETVKNQTVRDRPILVRRFSATDDLRGCHLLFVSRSEEERLPAILDAARRTAMLSVGDLNHFAERGGMVNLVMKDELVRFEVNLQAAESQGLQISSKVLRYATVIPGTNRNETAKP